MVLWKSFSSLLRSPTIVRQICLSHLRFARTHYQILGLPAGATQADIKRAYYDLSMKFHPDKQHGNEDKFREITTAYEVLGNPKLRRMYDRGIISDEQLDASIHYPTESGQGPFEYGEEDLEKRKKTVRSFDKWAQTHASHTFNRMQYEKSVRKKIDHQKQQSNASSAERLIWLIILLFVGICSFSYAPSNNSKQSNDKKKS